MSKKAERYSDIIDLPHHQSVCRPHMPNYNRAAQFAPFAALVGYDEMVVNTVSIRLSEKRKELGEDDKRVLDEKLRVLQKHLKEKPEIEVTFYDDSTGVKGSVYRLVVGKLKKVGEFSLTLIVDKEIKIYYEDILKIKSEFFAEYF